MQYVGVQSQIWKNNINSCILLLLFPSLLLTLLWAFFYTTNYLGNEENASIDIGFINSQFITAVPFVFILVSVWFLIAWASHSTIIKKATSSKSLERKTNTRVYNLVENLCIAKGIKIPKIYVIEDDSLNAFASGISEKTFAVSLSRGIINKLDDKELEAVIAHELTHIINRDVRLLIISIVFVGIFAFITKMAFRSLRHIRLGGKSKKSGGIVIIILVIVLLGVIGYLFSLLFRFTLSRKREFLADAGAVEMTKNPTALVNALNKISKDPWIEAVQREDVAQMFIEHPTKKKKKSITTFFNNLFATHPTIEKRIEFLQQI